MYERAVLALTDCSRIDECQQWANKAEALASYAKQAKDEQLRKMANRIQGRAIARCGELLKQIPDQSGKRTDIEPDDGTVTRSQAATDAGMSERQKVTALRVATFAEQQPEEFERQIESDAPPTVTRLAEQGRQARSHSLRAASAFVFAALRGALRRFASSAAAQSTSRWNRRYACDTSSGTSWALSWRLMASPNSAREGAWVA